MKKLMLICIFTLMTTAAALVYYNFIYLTTPTIVPFSSIQGLSNEALTVRGVYYEVEEKVVCRHNNIEHPYVFKITPLNTKLFHDRPLVLICKTTDFNRVVHEIVFTSKHDNIDYTLNFSKGIENTIIDIVMSPIDIVSHPLEFAKSIGKVSSALFNGIKDLVVGNNDFGRIKAQVQQFAEMYWYDLCCRKAKSYDLDYPSLVYASSRKIIENDAKSFLSGQATAEIVTLYLAFSKAAKVEEVATIARSESIFENIRGARSLEKIPQFGADDEYLKMVEAGEKGFQNISDRMLEKISERLSKTGRKVSGGHDEVVGNKAPQMAEAVKKTESRNLSPVKTFEGQTQKAEQISAETKSAARSTEETLTPRVSEEAREAGTNPGSERFGKSTTTGTEKIRQPDKTEKVSHTSSEAKDAQEASNMSEKSSIGDGTQQSEKTVISEAETHLQPSQQLAKNMEAAGKPRPDGDHAAHHIVAHDAGLAAPARAKLQEFGIDLNSSENGVWLRHKRGSGTGSYHPELHTNKYYEEVNRRISQVKTKEEAIEVLQDIAKQLSNDIFPY